MKTLVFENSIGTAPEIIRSGGLVAVPTETVYGLAGNGLDSAAVEKIYEVKGRPAVKPLSIMVPGREAMDFYCTDVPDSARKLADEFWPGPLTIVLSAKDIVPEIVRAGGKTVGLRCPACELTLEALRKSGVPFAAPSANPSGEPSPKSAGAVLEYFDGSIDAVIDGGECTLGVESTLIDMSCTPYRILRQGALSGETLSDALADMMTVIGITGPSGTGKTSALEYAGRCFPDGTCKVIDCDGLYHGLLESSPALRNELSDEFPGVLEGDTVCRNKLGEIVYADPVRLERLNEITHRHIVAELKEILRGHALNGGTAAVIDASELIGSPAESLCDITVSILAPRTERIRRITARDGITEAEAIRRIDAQHADAYYISHTDRYIMNDGSMGDFENEVKRIIKDMR